MKKSLLSIIIIVLGVFVFAGCNDDNNEDTTPTEITEGTPENVAILKGYLEDPGIKNYITRRDELSDSDTTYWCNYGEILATIDKAVCRVEEFNDKKCFLLNLTDDCPWHLDELAKYPYDFEEYPNHFKKHPTYYIGIVPETMDEKFRVGNIIKFKATCFYRYDQSWFPLHYFMTEFKLLQQ